LTDRSPPKTPEKLYKGQDHHLGLKKDSLSSLVSKSYKPEYQMDRWQAIQPRLNRMFPANRPFGKSSPFVPRDTKEWLEHRDAIKEAARDQEERRKAWSDEVKKWEPLKPYLYQPFDNQVFGSFGYGLEFENQNYPHLSPVLGQETIWNGIHVVVAPPWRQLAEWPSQHEMEWEGDMRVATEDGRYGRFPPLPRVGFEGDGKIWSERPIVKSYPLDEVRRIPTMEDVIAPVDEVEDPDIIKKLLNQDLLDILNDPPISVTIK
jgi:hypothetical protein